VGALDRANPAHTAERGMDPIIAHVLGTPPPTPDLERPVAGTFPTESNFSEARP
jgi:hypothetical protein